MDPIVVCIRIPLTAISYDSAKTASFLTALHSLPLVSLYTGGDLAPHGLQRGVPGPNQAKRAKKADSEWPKSGPCHSAAVGLRVPGGQMVGPPSIAG